MALISDDVLVIETKPDDKNPSFIKQKINFLIGLLIVIIILLCILIIVLTTTNISGNTNQQINNGSDVTTQKHPNPPQIPNSPIIDDVTDPTAIDEPQLINSTHKMVYRSEWGGRPPLFKRPQKVPVKYVIISHTASEECFNLISCSKLMQYAQAIHVDAGSSDIGYNFAIGGDGNIYVGRGWDNHNFHMKLDTIGVTFIGNYIFNSLSLPMITAAQDLLKNGVKLGKLTQNYTIVAHNQTFTTLSPGANVYKQIKFWPHFSPDLLEDIPA